MGLETKNHKCFFSFQDDFQPASVDTSQEGTLEVGQGHHVTLTVPHVEVRYYKIF